MKKKVIYILAAVFMMPLATSCDEWLEEHPKAVAVDSFYNTVDDANAAIAACSNKLRSIKGGSAYSAFMECFADYDYGRGSWQPNSTYELLNTQNKGRTDGLWSNEYKVIRDANICISKFPSANALSETQKAQYIAEARFYRAIAYYDIVRLWGKGVLRTEENLEEWNLPMSSGAEIWNLIISDLKDAVANCPDKPVMVGRPAKNAARTLLAEVYMTRKEYSAALPLLKAVIDSKEYSLVSVATSNDFDNLFGHDNVSSTEEIFYQKTSRTNTSGWELVMYYAHPSAVVPGRGKMSGAGGWYALTLSSENKWIKNWDDKDLRKGYCYMPYSSMGMFEGVNLDGLCVKFVDPDATGSYGNCDNPIFRYADVLMMYAEALNQTAGPSAEAMEYLNMIHRRAYGHNPSSPSEDDLKLADYNTKEKFMEILVQEQCYEFFGEAKRWPFLVRTGLADKYVKEYKGRTVNPNLYAFPIPDTEFTYNEALDPAKDQNPGY